MDKFNNTRRYALQRLAFASGSQPPKIVQTQMIDSYKIANELADVHVWNILIN